MASKAYKKKRNAEKKSKKAAKKAAYIAMRDSGNNQKNKYGSGAGRRVVKLMSHPNGSCANVGCRKCSGLAQELHARPHFNVFTARMLKNQVNFKQLLKLTNN